MNKCLRASSSALERSLLAPNRTPKACCGRAEGGVCSVNTWRHQQAGTAGHLATLRGALAGSCQKTSFRPHLVLREISLCAGLRLTSQFLSSNSTLPQSLFLKHIPGDRREIDVRGWERGSPSWLSLRACPTQHEGHMWGPHLPSAAIRTSAHWHLCLPPPHTGSHQVFSGE